MSGYDSQNYTATGNGGEVIIDEKSAGLLRIGGTFSGTVQLQVQKGNDLQRTLAESDWITVSEYTEPTVQNIEGAKRLRFRTKMSAFTSGQADVELNGS